MALLGIRFLCKNLRILEACAPNRSFVLENMSTKPVEGKTHAELISALVQAVDTTYSNEVDLGDLDKQITSHTWS